MAERTDRVPALALDLAGDSLWDPLPLPDPELDPDELDELERLPLDPRPEAELSLEEEVPDGDRCGEGDLAHLRLGGEHTAAGELRGRPGNGIVSALFETWTAAVEVEVAGMTLALLGWPALSAVDDGILQNVLGISASVKGGSVRKIQVVKPQPRLHIGHRREPTDNG